VRLAEGRRGQALELGKDVVVAAPVNIDPRQHPQLAISAWIKRPASGGNSGFIVCDSGIVDTQRRLPDSSRSGIRRWPESQLLRECSSRRRT